MPGGSLFTDLRSGSLDANYMTDNHAAQQFARLNRHSLGNSLGFSPQINEPSTNQHFNRLQRGSMGSSLGHDSQNNDVQASQNYARLHRHSWGHSMGPDTQNNNINNQAAQHIARLTSRSMGAVHMGDQQDQW